jgi:putative hemolysin
MIFGNLALIIILIGLNAFFVSVEFAAVASRRSRLDLLADAHGRASQLVRAWLEDPAARERLIAATQLGITMVNLALGAVAENAFAALLEPYFQQARLPEWLQFVKGALPALPLILSLAIVTSLTVVLGEQVPKVATLRSPERLALLYAPLMQVFSTIFKWFIDLLNWATHLVLRLVGIPESAAHPAYSLEELRQIVSGPETAGMIDPPEREMINAVLDFGELVVRQVALPRTEIQAVEADAPLDELIRLASESNLTKFPVYEEDLDHIVGIVHIRDLLAAWLNPERRNTTARSLAREALFVPETISVNDLLYQFRTRNQHIAIVLDEYGGTAGLVTLEDLVEEIVGEFRGPFEARPPAIQTLPDGSALVDGLALIDEINEHFGLHLHDPNYDTIAGYVLGRLGRIPKVGDVVEDAEEGIRLEVESMDRLRIARLVLRRLPSPVRDELREK